MRYLALLLLLLGPAAAQDADAFVTTLDAVDTAERGELRLLWGNDAFIVPFTVVQ